MIILLILAVLAILGISRLLTGIYAAPRTYTTQDVPDHRAAVVFGAGLRRDGYPTPILQDRVETAADLYFSGKVEKILMSGDNSTLDYNEPESMRQYALSLGVPDKDIVMDYAGRRTYDTCYRAKTIFGLQDAILVTQAFHMPRAIYTCNMLGLQSVGVEANNRHYFLFSLAIWNIRELAATVTAFVDLHITHPHPILGNPEPIFPPNAQ